MEQVDADRGVLQGQHVLARCHTPEPEFTDVLELDLATVQPSLAGPKRPQDRVLLKDDEGASSARSAQPRRWANSGFGAARRPRSSAATGTVMRADGTPTKH